MLQTGSGTGSLLNTIYHAAAGTSLALTARAERVDQIDKFTRHQVVVQRVLSVSSATVSIVFCLGAIYMFLAIDPRRLIFRHQLITFLLLFDLLRAIILLLYTTIFMTHFNSYYNDKFCQAVGFLTATAIEGADFAILAFAIHTFLLIFKPSLSVKTSNGVEGGLYRFRFYVYGLSFLIPLILASLAYIGNGGYNSFVCWCYLPQRPVWYRLVLSWVPRYIIFVFIMGAYAFIYFHVIREFRTLGGVFTTIHRLRMQHGTRLALNNEKPSFYSALKYFFRAVKDALIPSFVLPDESQPVTAVQSNVSADAPKLSSHDITPDEENGATFSNEPDIHAANLESFRKRQRAIEKQMKSIFIYPFAYLALWLFPFILQTTQVNYEFHHHPIYWLNCMGAFFQPLNGFVDTLVFFYREQPWKYTILRNFEKEYVQNMNQTVFLTHSSSSMATSAKLTSQSLCAGMIDYSTYPRWRRILARLHLPFFTLPTPENMSKLQEHYLHARFRRPSIHNLRSAQIVKSSAPIAPLDGHDFSNILLDESGENTILPYTASLEKFTLDFNRRNSQGSNSVGIPASYNGYHRRGSLISSDRSHRSRQMSTVDPNEPIIDENQELGSQDNSGLKPNYKYGRPLRTSTSSATKEEKEMDFMEFLSH